MNWIFNNDLPIYIQIASQIKAQIASGALKPGDKIPPVREIAIEAGVNPNTMQRAMTVLEREGIVYSNRTAGRFVSDKTDISCTIHKNLADEYLNEFVEKMHLLGMNSEEIVEYVKNNIERK